MKIATILGTRPEIIRLSRIIPKLDAVSEHVLIHTGQNYTPSLSDNFLKEFDIREPDHFLGVKADTAAGIIAQVIERTDRILEAEKPDRILILGDTNSGLAAIPAQRRGIPVFHMEAGNRCYDIRVPEEGNRRIIDHSSEILLPYTEGSRRILLAEGIPSNRVYVTGNPIKEVLDHYQSEIDRSVILADLELGAKDYILATLHRAENVDSPDRLATFIEGFNRVADTFGKPVVVSTHPRTRDKMTRFGITGSSNVRFLEPFGFFDFVHLEKQALCVLSDSGTVQEECCLLNIPTVTLRDTTERPETIDCGSNILSGCDAGRILECVRAALAFPPSWTAPREYLQTNVSDVVTRILLTHFMGRTGS